MVLAIPSHPSYGSCGPLSRVLINIVCRRNVFPAFLTLQKLGLTSTNHLGAPTISNLHWWTGGLGFGALGSGCGV